MAHRPPLPSIEYAKTRNATRVVVGSPKRKPWWNWFQPSTSTQLIKSRAKLRRHYDCHRRGIEPRAATPTSASANDPPPQIRWDRYAWAVVTTAACTAVAFVLYPRFELSNLVMVYLLGVTLSGLRFGRGPSVLVSLLNVAAFDFFFVPPRYTFAISDGQYFVTFAVMLIIALVDSEPHGEHPPADAAWPVPARGARQAALCHESRARSHARGCRAWHKWL